MRGQLGKILGDLHEINAIPPLERGLADLVLLGVVLVAQAYRPPI